MKILQSTKGVLILIVIIVVGLLVAGRIVMAYRNSNSTSLTQNTQNLSQSGSLQSTSDQTTNGQQSSVVTITSSGFDPQTLTIKAGTTVVWQNKSGDTVSVNSNDHPTHLLYPPLNLGMVPDGGTLSLRFDQSGSYGYHNHLNPSEKGTIVVQ